MASTGLDRMVAVSLLAHAAVAALVLMTSGSWARRDTPPAPVVMTVSLSGGDDGPTSGGFTAIGGRAVQEVAPPAPRPEPVAPPAAAAPVMTLPTPKAAPVPKRPAPVVPTPSPDARGRLTTKGTEVRAGSAVAETGARGQGFGLATGGGQGVGARLDVANFCCPDYLAALVSRIREAWQSHADVTGTSIIRFTVTRSGAVVTDGPTAPAVEQSCGAPTQDLAALRAVLTARQLAPLPSAFPNPTLTIHLNFAYTR